MKKLITAIVLTSIVIASLTYTAILLAAPGDIRLVLVIEAADVATFKAQFLAKCPIPMIEDPDWLSDPNNIGRAPMVPEYTAKGWMEEWLWWQLDRARWHGEQKLALQMVIRKPSVIKKGQ